MQPHTRALVAASAFAILTGKKVAGLYDHSAKRRRKVAAEFRLGKLLAFDGHRNAAFGGTPPELYDAEDKSHVSFEVIDGKARGHDRYSSSDFSAQVTDNLVQVYDYAEQAWFSYDVQDPNAAKNFHRV